LTARSINEKLFIVSRADSFKAIKKLEKAGANRVISPAIIGGRRMATMLFKPLVCDFLDVVSQSDNIEYQLEEIVIQKNSTFVNSMIKDSGIREKHGALVLAIQKRTGELSTSPSPETIIEENDKLVIMGTKWQINSLNEALNK
ncbi:MAG: TrkA family potassium uptake protein, partial [Actinomycetia bacterium]|nr:TrkA family potassium uptake protein [Actinomycetes bacterium]